MIRGTVQTLLALTFFVTAALIPGAAAESQREDIPRMALSQGERMNDENGVEHDGMTARNTGDDTAQPILMAAAKPGIAAKKLQKFIDEDGDGYNDRKPEAVQENAAGEETSDTSNGKKNGKTATGVEKAAGEGSKKGQNNPGLGISGALERGMKKGQNSTKNSPEGITTDNSGNFRNAVKNNGQNRFDRNFEKYDRSSKKNMEGGKGQNK